MKHIRKKRVCFSISENVIELLRTYTKDEKINVSKYVEASLLVLLKNLIKKETEGK